MSRFLWVSTLVSALGCGLVAGAFFAFSSFVMAALGRLPPAQGIAAMQSINVVVINPVFMTALFGTGAVCLLVAVLSLAQSSAVVYLVTASLVYIVGNIVVTMICNVPLNNALAAVNPASAEGAQLWAHYLDRWVMWNHVRTVTALAAAALFTLGLT